MVERYRMTGNCSLRSLRGSFLLTVCSSGREERYKVNGSFADVFGHFRALPYFLVADITAFLLENFDISEPDAQSEADRVLAIWKHYGIVEQLPQASA